LLAMKEVHEYKQKFERKSMKIKKKSFH